MARCVFPTIAEGPELTTKTDADSSMIQKTDSMQVANDVESLPVVQSYKYNGKSRFFNEDGSLVKNRIYRVPHFVIPFLTRMTYSFLLPTNMA